MKEIITILGKATPVFSEDLRNGLICTVGINENDEFRRLYPVPLDTYEKISNWSIIEVELLQQGERHPNSRHIDNRPETRVIDTTKENPFKVVGEINNVKKRFEVIKRLINPSEEWIKEQKEPKRTIGIILPDILKIEVAASQQEPKKPKSIDHHSLLEYVSQEIKEESERKRILEKYLRKYTTRILDVHFKFKCHFNSRCSGHNKMALDDGLHQRIMRLSKEKPINEVIDKIIEEIQEKHSKSWIFFGLGTVSHAPFYSYTIGSVFRLPKSKISQYDIDNLLKKTKQAKLSSFY